MTTETLLLLIIIAFIVGIFPSWPHSRSWGYVPSGALTLFLVVFVLWVITGDRPLFRSSGRNTIQDAGQDLKSAGRDVADSIRHTVQ